jgi:hypothetical protein
MVNSAYRSLSTLVGHPLDRHVADRAGRHIGVAVRKQPAAGKARHRRPRDRRDPEQPQLLERPAADEQRRPGAARRIASGATGIGDRSSVAPRMTIRNPAVSSASVTKLAASE